MRIREKQKIDRPREKLASKGVSALTDLELIQAIIGSGNKQADVTKISRKLHKVLKENAGQVEFDDLNNILGMGAARTAEIISALELAQRLSYKDEKLLDYRNDQRTASQITRHM